MSPEVCVRSVNEQETNQNKSNMYSVNLTESWRLKHVWDLLQTESQAFEKLHLTLELPNGTLALKNGKQFKAHPVILVATKALAPSNYGELQQLFETFTRVWEAGGQTSLHLPPCWGELMIDTYLSMRGEKHGAIINPL